jgi:NADH:ubiquinone oxidoreductase subunit 4 (subunit M)
LSPGVVSVLAVTLALTILIGLYPEPFISMAQQAISTSAF